MPSYAEIASRNLNYPDKTLSIIPPYTRLPVHEIQWIAISSDEEIRAIVIPYVRSRSKAEEEQIIKKYRHSIHYVVYRGMIISDNWMNLEYKLYNYTLPRYCKKHYESLLIRYHDSTSQHIIRSRDPLRVFSGTHIYHFHRDLCKVLQKRDTPIQAYLKDGIYTLNYSPISILINDNIQLPTPETETHIFSVSIVKRQGYVIEAGNDLVVRTDRISYPRDVTYNDLFHLVLPLIYTRFSSVPNVYGDLCVYT